jgi:dienelactone hydrolase
MGRLCFWLMAVVLFASSVHAAPKAEIAKYASSAGGVEIAGYYFRPPGEGPFSVVIGMHGCGGLFEDNRRTLLDTRIDWAERFLKAGYLLVYPDSYGSRGFGSVCEIKPEDLKVRLVDQVGDLAGTVNWLTTQAFVDPQKIALIGWGTGGTAVMRILDPVLPVNKQVTFAAAVAIYPQCEFLLKSMKYEPLLLPSIHSGAADKLALPGPCRELAARWGSPFTAHPGAYHNFDAPNAPVRKRKYASGVVYVGTNRTARDKSIKETMAAFAAAFAAAPAASDGAPDSGAAPADAGEAAPTKGKWKAKALKSY